MLRRVCISKLLVQNCKHESCLNPLLNQRNQQYEFENFIRVLSSDFNKKINKPKSDIKKDRKDTTRNDAVPKKTILKNLQETPKNLQKLKLVGNNSIEELNANKDIVRLRKVLPRDALNVIRLFQDCFTKCEPLTSCLEIEKGPFLCPILREFWTNSIRQGMTYAAIPCNSICLDCLYGAVINTRLTPLEPDHWWLYAECSKNKKTKDLLNLWSYLVKDSAIHNKFGVKKILNISHVLINEDESIKLNPKFDKTNIAQILISKSFRIASTKGYKLAVIMCSDQMICKAAGNLNMIQIYEKPHKYIIESVFKNNVKKMPTNSTLKIYAKTI